MRKLIFNFIENIENFNSRIQHKYTILVILQVLIISFSLGIPMIKKSDSFASIVSSCTMLVIMMIFLLLEARTLKCYKVDKKYLVLFEIIGLSFVFNGLYFSVIGYLAIGLTFSFVIPLFEIASASSVKFSMCKVMAKGIFISFLIFLFISIACGPALGKNQYSAIFSNPNTLGNYMIVVNASILFLIFDAYRLKSQTTWFYLCAFAAELAITLFSNSRTCFIAVVLQIIFVLFILVLRCIKLHNKQNIIIVAKTILISILICILMFLSMFFILTDLKAYIMKTIPCIQISEEYENVTFKEIMGRTVLRYTKGFNDSQNSDTNTVNDNDAFTSGRKEIWKDFINNIGLLGHSQEGREIKEELRFYENTNAHNVYIQMAYSAGFFAGIAMVVLALLTAKDILALLIHGLKNKMLSNDSIFMICNSIGFAIVSITSGGYMIYTYLPATLFYFSIYKVSIKKRSTQG